MAFTDKSLVQGRRGEGERGVLVQDPESSYFVFRNSWGTGWGEVGFGFAKMSNPNSPQFTDPTYGGTCGIASAVSIWQ